MNVPFDYRRLVSDLKALLAALPPGDDVSHISDNRRRKLRNEIVAMLDRLESLSRALDPIAQPVKVYDPSDPAVIGELIARTLLQQARIPMKNIERFYGSGVYAIYYQGEFLPYQEISRTQHPIYVGKANPKSQRAITAEEQGEQLSKRLREHRESVHDANNLSLDDFECRFLVVKSAWQGTAENYLIRMFKPVWNGEVGVCSGFGKHGDSHKTRSNKRSEWDTIHLGRPWATREGNKPNDRTGEDIAKRIQSNLKENPPLVDGLPD